MQFRYSFNINDNRKRTLMALRKPEQAISEFRTVVRMNPDFPDAHYYLGRCYLSQDRLAEAEAALREAVRLNSSDAEAHNALGIVLARGGQLEAAKEHLRSAAQLKPSNAVFSENLDCAEHQLQGCALQF